MHDKKSSTIFGQRSDTVLASNHVSLLVQIKNDIKEAMRAHEALRLDTLRGLSAAFNNELLKKPGTTALSDEDVIAVIRRSVKQRKDSIEQFEKGGRADLADKEKAELAVLDSYLPKLMSKDEINKFIKAKIANGAPFEKAKAGQFMGGIMKELKGKADGADVKAVVETLD
ncbi:MAG: GatB/YqeY domain-containing protein [Candidatus Pacebacteria bacterium]|nr:GatB/YqeY domain-containing protein [Candidatus Paceibacterota bacterium]